MTRSSRLLLPFALVVLAASLAAGVPRAAATDPFPTSGPRRSRATTSGSSERRGRRPARRRRSPRSTRETCSAWPSAPTPSTAAGATRPRSRTAATGSPTSPSTTSSPGCLTVRLDRHRRCRCRSSRWDARHHSGRPAGADQIHLNAATGAQLPHRRAPGLSPLRGRGLPPDTNQWLHEGLAEWAAVRAESAIGGLEQNPDRTMDCVGSVCGDTEFDRNGYPGWMLFEYLAERFGDSDGQVGPRHIRRQPRPLGNASPLRRRPATRHDAREVLRGLHDRPHDGELHLGAPRRSAAANPGLDRRGLHERRNLPGDARSQPPCRSLSRSRARCRHRHRALLLGVACAQSRAARRRRVNALLLREHEGRDRPAVHGLRQHRHVDGPVEHVRGQPARVRVATERDERRGARLHSTDASSRSPERSRSTSRSPQARASRPQA